MRYVKLLILLRLLIILIRISVKFVTLSKILLVRTIFLLVLNALVG